MKLEQARVGFALCGSYCTHAQTIRALAELVPLTGQITPILAETSGSLDTRFGRNQTLRMQLEAICGASVLDSIPLVEPIGPRGLLDLLIIAPCTGNTLAKLACGITDTAITMAAKAHLRNGRPVLIAPSTNDGLSVSLRNLGDLMCRRHYYFVPFRQDDPAGKPNSLVYDPSLLAQAAVAALEGRQLQPVLLAAG